MGERLIHQEAKQGVGKSLDEGEGGVEDEKALPKAIRRGEDHLIQTDDHLHSLLHRCPRHEHRGINGIDEKIVGGEGHQRHQDRSREASDESAAAPPYEAIENSRGKNEGDAKEEIGKLSHAEGLKPIEKEVDEVFDKAN